MKRLVVAVVCALTSAGTASASPEPLTPRACMQEAESAQTLRRQGKFGLALSALVVCGDDACPTVVRDDCRTWTAELRAAQPTIVLSVKGPDGGDVVAARVLVDGSSFQERIDGLSRPLDPGPHEIVVTAPSEAPVHLRLVAHEGERDRVVRVAFPVAPAASAAVASYPRSAEPLTPWAWVTGAIGVAGVAGFAYFGLTALSDHAAMRDGCATTHACTDDEIAANKTKFWLADASLLVGLIGGVATGVLVYRHAQSAPSTSRAGDVRLSVRAGSGAFASVTAAF